MEGENQSAGSHGQLDRVIHDNTLHELSLSDEVTDTVPRCEEEISPSNFITVLDVPSDNIPTELKECVATNNVSV